MAFKILPLLTSCVTLVPPRLIVRAPIVGWACAGLPGPAVSPLGVTRRCRSAAFVGFLLVRGLVLWRRRSQQRQQQQLYQMVESIMDVVRRHTLTAAGADKVQSATVCGVQTLCWTAAAAGVAVRLSVV